MYAQKHICKLLLPKIYKYIKRQCLFKSGSARGVMDIVTGIGHGDTSSNPGLIAFHIALIPLGKV